MSEDDGGECKKRYWKKTVQRDDDEDWEDRMRRLYRNMGPDTHGGQCLSLGAFGIALAS